MGLFSKFKEIITHGNPRVKRIEKAIEAGTFKKGGRVKRTGKALVHKGEFILPKGIPPTKLQIKKVCKRGGIL